ncbi:MAG: Spy/CpxP family protein refolding chaperone [Bacteroidetes bacterium]|nr:Spy/CpxP family protein refolding chaperone [Bacteroidota bacterium]
MKKVKFKSLALLMVAALLSINTSIFAQKANMQMMNTKNCNIPNLTEEQETKIEKLRTAHMEDMIGYKTQFEEKKAHKKSLMVAKAIDLKTVNKTIDEMSAIRVKMQKMKAKHHKDVRSLLTPEQKVFFNNRYINKRGNNKSYGRRGNGMRNGTGNKMGNGTGNGNGMGNHSGCRNR